MIVSNFLNEKPELMGWGRSPWGAGSGGLIQSPKSFHQIPKDPRRKNLRSERKQWRGPMKSESARALGCLRQLYRMKIRCPGLCSIPQSSTSVQPDISEPANVFSSMTYCTIFHDLDLQNSSVAFLFNLKTDFNKKYSFFPLTHHAIPRF